MTERSVNQSVASYEPDGRGEVVTKRVLLALFLIAATWGFTAQLQGKDRAPETELVFLYHSGTKGETDECG